MPDQQLKKLSYMAELTSDIRHVADKENMVANTLSWPAAQWPSHLVNLEQFVVRQLQC
jgi:hypothetical protein